jgi:hypothetical protein
MLQHGGRFVCLCAVLWAANAAHADADAPPLPGRETLVAQAWRVADDAQLEAMRGGFELGSLVPGLAVSFGFARSVSINGERVFEMRFNLPDLAHITTDQAKQVSAVLAHAMVVQNGLGNSVGSGTTQRGLGTATVVQNSLNNQNIQTLTQIDAGVNSMGLLRSILTRGTLRDALMDAIGVR